MSRGSGIICRFNKTTSSRALSLVVLSYSVSWDEWYMISLRVTKLNESSVGSQTTLNATSAEESYNKRFHRAVAQFTLFGQNHTKHGDHCIVAFVNKQQAIRTAVRTLAGLFLLWQPKAQSKDNKLGPLHSRAYAWWLWEWGHHDPKLAATSREQHSSSVSPTETLKLT